MDDEAEEKSFRFNDSDYDNVRTKYSPLDYFSSPRSTSNFDVPQPKRIYTKNFK